MDKLSIKKGSIDIELPRSSLINITQCPDGLVFNFKNCYFYLTDAEMPNNIKNLISTSYDSFKFGDVEINLDNYRRPINVKL